MCPCNTLNTRPGAQTRDRHARGQPNTLLLLNAIHTQRLCLTTVVTISEGVFYFLDLFAFMGYLPEILSHRNDQAFVRLSA